MVEKSKAKKIEPIRAKKELWLTGTPLLGSPIDLFPILKRIDPNGLGRDWFTFAKRYCNAIKTPFGWDTTGSSNLEELNTKLRQSFMIRRMKSEVMKDLPPKLRQVVLLPEDGMSKLLARELSAIRSGVRQYMNLIGTILEDEKTDLDKEFFNYIRYLDLQKARGIRIEKSLAFEELATARKELALAKIPMAVQYINSLIESGEKVIVFCHHIAVADALAKEWPQCIVITGKTPVAKRQALVDLFQEDRTRNPIIGNIGAMGVGYTLTAATHVVFIELVFNWSLMEQAEDRAHRIGQQDNVTVHWLLVENSFDARNVEILLDQQEIIGKALDMRLSDLDINMVNSYG